MPLTAPDAKIETLLAGRHIAALATQNADGSIQLTAVWYLYEGGTLYVATSSQLRKARNVAARPQVSLMVDTRHGGADRGVTAIGRAELISGDAARAIALRLHRRYLSEAALVDHLTEHGDRPPPKGTPKPKPALAGLARFGEPLIAPFRVAVTAAIKVPGQLVKHPRDFGVVARHFAARQAQVVGFTPADLEMAFRDRDGTAAQRIGYFETGFGHWLKKYINGAAGRRGSGRRPRRQSQGPPPVEAAPGSLPSARPATCKVRRARGSRRRCQARAGCAA